MVRCNNCGTIFDEAYNICPKCGTAYNAYAQDKMSYIPAPETVPVPIPVQKLKQEKSPEKKKSKGKLIAIITLIAVFAIGIGIALLIFLMSGTGAPSFQEQLSLGEKYLSEERYDDAIDAFKKAIELDPMNPDAYIKLADTYIAKGDYAKALEALNTGYEKTKNQKIKTKIDELSVNQSETNDNKESSKSEPQTQNVPNKQMKFKSFCSDYRTEVVTKSGDLYMWGENNLGTVGNGTTTSQLTPQKIMSNVKEAGIESVTSYAITENSDLYMWGYNNLGSIGNGTKEIQQTPQKIMSAVKTAGTYKHTSYAITENGDLYMWGINIYGTIGNDTTNDQLTPIKIMGNVKKAGISKNTYPTSYAITQNGDLYMWGDNKSGQIGNGTTENHLNPQKIMSNVETAAIYSSSTSYAITDNGDLYMWGNNKNGQIGNSTTDNQLTPYKIELDAG